MPPPATNVSIAAREGKLIGRELQPFVLPSGDDDSLEGALSALEVEEGTKGGAAKWDQFAANAALFGVHATFKPEAYTSKLDVSKFSAADLARADAIAAAMMGDTAGMSNPHIRAERSAGGGDDDSGDEEALHSAVLRPAASAAPATSAGAADTFTDAAVAAKAGTAGPVPAPGGGDAKKKKK